VKSSSNPSARLGRNVAQLRRELGLTQETLAEKLEVSARHVQSIEGGLRAPSLKLLARLRQVLGCDWNQLFSGL